MHRSAIVIRQTQPWLKTTGPKTKRGKAIAAQNARKADGPFQFKRVITSWQTPNYGAERNRVERAIDLLEAECKALRDCSNRYVQIKADIKVTRQHDADGEGNRWSVYAAKCHFSLKIRSSWECVLPPDGTIPQLDEARQAGKPIQEFFHEALDRIEAVIIDIKCGQQP